MPLTDTGLRGWKWTGKDAWLSDGGSRGAARLVAKRSQSAVTFYFQYFDSTKRKRFLNVGPYDGTGKRGLTLQAARDRAADLSRLYRSGTPDLHAHFDAVHEASRRARDQAEAEARIAEELAKQSTLRQLLNTYVTYLESAGKARSAYDAKTVFRMHVFDAAPALSERRAGDCSVDEFVGLIGKCVESGRGRAAAKLRSYLRAAYSLAIRSKTDPTAPLSLRAFGIQSNPIASIAALSQFSRTRDRSLSMDELGAFLRRLDAQPPTVKRDALAACIELGGQRPQQLLRVRPEDVDLSVGTITLFDPKGARKQPRQHVLPITKNAVGILRRRLDNLAEDISEVEGGSGGSARRPRLVFTSDGKRPMHSETLSEVVREISAAMMQAGEARAPFQMRDLRRTAETLLASLGVSRDVRGQIQSHGLGGVQNRHYDRHNYALEKKAALDKWQRYLEKLRRGDTATIISAEFKSKQKAV